jgi:hypothetical protein
MSENKKQQHDQQETDTTPCSKSATTRRLFLTCPNPEHGFSLFLANRTKTIHFIRVFDMRMERTMKPIIHTVMKPTVRGPTYIDACLTDLENAGQLGKAVP